MHSSGPVAGIVYFTDWKYFLLSCGFGTICSHVDTYRLGARSPVGRTDLAVLVVELNRLERAQRLVDGAPNAEVVDRDVSENALWVDDEEAAQRDAGVGEDAVVRGHLLRDVREEGNVEMAQPALVARLVDPRQMAVLRVDRRSNQLAAQRAELPRAVRERNDLGRADERKVERVEEEHEVLAAEVLQANLLEFAANDGRRTKVRRGLLHCGQRGIPAQTVELIVIALN